MATWQILTVNRIGDGRWNVLYLIDGKERRKAIVHDRLGLDFALAAMGVHLASQPRLKNPHARTRGN
jgi:hypothetical protein